METINTGYIKEDMKHPKARIFWRIIISVLLLGNFIVFGIGMKSQKNIEFFWVKIKNRDTIYSKGDNFYTAPGTLISIQGTFSNSIVSGNMATVEILPTNTSEFHYLMNNKLPWSSYE